MATAKYPGAIVTLADLGGQIAGIPNVEYTLDGTILVGAAPPFSLVVEETPHASLPASGYLTVENEILHYSAVNAGTKTFTIDLRAQQDTTAAEHLAGVKVRHALTKEQVNQVSQEVVALQTALGVNLGSIPHSPNLIPNSDFSRRAKWMTFMPEVFAGAEGVTTVHGSAGSVATNTYTPGAVGGDGHSLYQEGLSTWRDTRVSVAFKFGEDGSSYVGAVARLVDASNFVSAELVGGATDVFRIRKRVAGTYTTVASVAFSPTLDTRYWAEIEFQGTTVIAKLYSSGASQTAKSSATLQQTLTGTILDSALAAGAAGFIASNVAHLFGELSTGDGGVYVEGWGPESVSVTFAGTKGGQAIGFVEAADSGPIGKQWCMRFLRPADDRVMAFQVDGPDGGIVPSANYLGSIYGRFVSVASGTATIVRPQFMLQNSAFVAVAVKHVDISTASSTSWHRLVTAVLSHADARRHRLNVSTPTGGTAVNAICEFLLPQLEQGSAATAWRNAASDEAPLVWELVPTSADITTTSTSQTEMDARSLAANIFLPWDATVEVSPSIGGHRNSIAGSNHRFDHTVGGSGPSGFTYYAADVLAVADVAQAFSYRVAHKRSAGKTRVALRWSVSAGTGRIQSSVIRTALIVTATRGK